MDLTGWSFLDNPPRAWALAAVWFLGSALLLKMLLRAIVGRLESLVERTRTDLDDLIGFYADQGGSFDVLTDSAGHVVGSVGLALRGDGRCELRKMYLAPQARGRGLGKRLLAHALTRAAALGCRRIELETASVLREAINLYRAAGFRELTPKHLSPRCDRAYFLDLSPASEPAE